MNVKSLIQQIKLRPGMYVGDPNLEAISHFISGFLYNNTVTNRADAVDLAFRTQFHEYVKAKLEKTQNIKFCGARNYVFYISQTFQSTEQRLKTFFELCDDFFIEIEKDNI